MRYRIEGPIDDKTSDFCATCIGSVIEVGNYIYPPHREEENCRCRAMPEKEDQGGVVIIDGVRMELTADQKATIREMFIGAAEKRSESILEFLGIPDATNVYITGWHFSNKGNHEKV